MRSPSQPTPFWRRMPQFFRFPAYRAPLLRNLVLSAILATAVAALWPVLAGIAALAATLYLTYYGFVVIERSAQGYLYPNDYPKTPEAGPWRPLKMFAILVATFFVVGVVSALAEALQMAALAFAALLLPASVMTLAVSDSLRQAINPARLLDMALKIGLPYLVLFLFLLILMGGSRQAFELVEPLLGESTGLLVFVSSFAGNYFFLIMCALMGYVLYQYGDDLGLDVIGPGELPAAGVVEDEQLDSTLGRLVAAGEISQAIALVDHALADRPDDLALHARAHKLRVLDGAPLPLEEHLDRYIDLLAANNRAGEALALAGEALARDANWSPRQPGHVAALARAALAAEKLGLVLALTRDFDVRHAGHVAAADVSLMRALALLAGGGSTAEARAALVNVIERFPEHEAATEARRHLARLDPAAV